MIPNYADWNRETAELAKLTNKELDELKVSFDTAMRAIEAMRKEVEAFKQMVYDHFGK